MQFITDTNETQLPSLERRIDAQESIIRLSEQDVEKFGTVPLECAAIDRAFLRQFTGSA